MFRCVLINSIIPCIPESDRNIMLLFGIDNCSNGTRHHAILIFTGIQCAPLNRRSNRPPPATVQARLDKRYESHGLTGSETEEYYGERKYGLCGNESSVSFLVWRKRVHTIRENTPKLVPRAAVWTLNSCRKS